MSNFLAVATATATLKNLLQSTIGMDEHDVQGVTVTTQRPKKEMPSPCVNIFLYQVTPNPYWRNNDLPSRNASNAKLVQRPRIALDLHYLVTFYGEESQLVPQRLLGSVMRTIHTYPVLTRKMIQNTIKMSQYQYLSTSDLANEIELVKFVPLTLNTEELSKIWSVFFQVDYALSIAYQASVVFIESDDAIAAPLPVRQPVVTVVPFNYPKISKINPPAIAYHAGAPLTIHGSSLQAGDQSSVTQVALGNNLLTPDFPLHAERLVVHLPDNARAGINAVQVRQQIDVGDHQLRPGFESNVATLIIQPVLESITFRQISNPVTGLPEIQHFDANIAPAVSVQQRAELLLNEFVPIPASNTSPPQPLTFTIPGLPRDTDSNSLIFETTGIPPGTYLVRVRVDGAESNLEIDTRQGSPTFNMPYKPTVEVL
ncbi:hypothetical protein PAALTS15_18243 [Paenibacillus alvei TS-15]|uniref:DUF4255 domain-containing protein n=1 Tax=Paenibacillus alvei TS-15 TaxID=1117108 RepID=S9SIX3_PAEAL|nr:DUF4255 domain-containing protein [Paenibacillus alvei]EPY05767.1 hypothetical protein PAALTS15_18243 [Paenibacillus alvei TS-15]